MRGVAATAVSGAPLGHMAAAAGSRSGAPIQDAPKRIFDAGGGKTVRLKIITQGSSLAGKSCLVKRFCEGKVS